MDVRAAVRARWARGLDDVRAWLGPHPDALEAMRQLRQARDDALAAQAATAMRLMADHATWDTERAELRRRERKAQHNLTLAFEPPSGPDCAKVRLRDRGEADTFARVVAEEVGRDPAAFRSYRCDRCPRQPLTGHRFWHIGNVDPSQRTNRGGIRTPVPDSPRAVARREGRTIGQRVARPVLEQREAGDA